MESKRISSQFRKSLAFFGKPKSSQGPNTTLRDPEGAYDDDIMSLQSSPSHEESFQHEESSKETKEKQTKKGSMLKKFRQSVKLGTKMNNQGSRGSFASPVSSKKRIMEGRASFSHAMAMMDSSEVTSSPTRTSSLYESPVSDKERLAGHDDEFDAAASNRKLGCETNAYVRVVDLIYSCSTDESDAEDLDCDNDTKRNGQEEIHDDQVDAAGGGGGGGSRRKLECETNAYVKDLIYACSTDESDSEDLDCDNDTKRNGQEEIHGDHVDAAGGGGGGSRRKLECETNAYVQSLIYACTTDESDDDSEDLDCDSGTKRNAQEEIHGDDKVDKAAGDSRRKLECETNAYAKDLIYACTTSESDDSSEDLDCDNNDGEDFLGTSEDHVDQSPLPGRIIDDNIVTCDKDSAEGKDFEAEAYLRRKLEELQAKLDQQQLKTEMLQESVAIHKSKAIEQEKQIALYKGMYEDAQEDHNTVMGKYNNQVEQNVKMLGVIETLKQRVWECEKELQEKQNQIQTMEQQLSKLQEQTTEDHDDHQLLLAKLQTDNERLQKMVDIQKRSLHQMCTAGGAGLF